MEELGLRAQITISTGFTEVCSLRCTQSADADHGIKLRRPVYVVVHN